MDTNTQPPANGQWPANYPVPTPPKKNWFLRHKFLTALLGLVALLVAMQACSGGTKTGGTFDTNSGTSDSQPQTATVGQKVRDGKFEFTVKSVKKGVSTVGSDFDSQTAQGQFVLVKVNVANIGDESQMLDASEQKLIDNKGRQHSSDFSDNSAIEGNDVFFERINPGNSVDGTFVFDIPKDASPASIELHDSMFSDGIKVNLK